MTFPPLSKGSTGRILTKHFTNLPLHLHKDSLAILSFLIYQSNHDNTIKINTRLLRQYYTAVTQAQQRYGKEQHISKSIPSSRKNIKRLEEKKLLIPHEGKHFINPLISFPRTFLSKGFYNTWVKQWQQQNQPQEHIPLFTNHINTKLKSLSDYTRESRKAKFKSAA